MRFPPAPKHGRGGFVRLAEAPYLVAAAVVHLALPVAAHVAPAPQVARSLLGHTDFGFKEIEVDLAPHPFLDPPTETDAKSFEPRPPDESLPIARHDIERPLNRRAPVPTSTTDPGKPPPAVLTAKDGSPQEPDFEYGRPPAPSEYTMIPIGPGGPRIWAIPGGMPVDPSRSAAPTKPGRRRKVDGKVAAKAVERAVRAKDKKLGLHFPAAGAIAGAVAGAVRAAPTPYTCTGVVAVAISGQGKLQNVRLVTYSGGSAGAWKQVVGGVKGALASRTFSMRAAYAKGALVTVSVRSQKRKPAGSGGREGLGLRFDPSNVGAKATRVVTTGVNVTPIK